VKVGSGREVKLNLKAGGAKSELQDGHRERPKKRLEEPPQPEQQQKEEDLTTDDSARREGEGNQSGEGGAGT